MNPMILRSNTNNLQKHKINKTLQYKNHLILIKVGLVSLMSQTPKFKQE